MQDILAAAVKIENISLDVSVVNVSSSSSDNSTIGYASHTTDDYVEGSDAPKGSKTMTVPDMISATDRDIPTDDKLAGTKDSEIVTDKDDATDTNDPLTVTNIDSGTVTITDKDRATNTNDKDPLTMTKNDDDDKRTLKRQEGVTALDKK